MMKTFDPEIDSRGRYRAYARVGGTTIVFASELAKAKKALRKLRIKAPRNLDRFLTLCSAAAMNPASEGVERWGLVSHPAAFAFVLFKLRESLRESYWTLQTKKRPRTKGRAGFPTRASILADLGKLALPTPNDLERLMQTAADPGKDQTASVASFARYPEAFCYAVLRVKNAGCDGAYSLTLRKAAKPCPAKSAKEIAYAMGIHDPDTMAETLNSRGFSSTYIDLNAEETRLQTKADENIRRIVRSRARQKEK